MNAMLPTPLAPSRRLRLLQQAERCRERGRALLQRNDAHSARGWFAEARALTSRARQA